MTAPKPRLTAVTWTQATFGALERAIQEAGPGRPNVTVDFGRRFGKHVFSWQEATDALATVAADFANNPNRQWPENREGKEP